MFSAPICSRNQCINIVEWMLDGRPQCTSSGIGLTQTFSIYGEGWSHSSLETEAVKVLVAVLSGLQRLMPALLLITECKICRAMRPFSRSCPPQHAPTISRSFQTSGSPAKSFRFVLLQAMRPSHAWRRVILEYYTSGTSYPDVYRLWTIMLCYDLVTIVEKGFSRTSPYREADPCRNHLGATLAFDTCYAALVNENRGNKDLAHPETLESSASICAASPVTGSLTLSFSASSPPS